MSEPEKQAEAARTYEVLMGGTQAEVTLAPAADGGQPEKRLLRVRQVPMRLLQELARAWGKEAEEIKVYSGLTDAEVDRLTEESWETLIEEGRRLNFQRFARWWARQQQTLKALGQDAETLAAKLAQDSLRSP